MFIALALSGFVPIVHVVFAQGAEGLQRFPLASIAVTCGSYLIGTGFYIARVPEKLWPGVFDVWVRSVIIGAPLAMKDDLKLTLSFVNPFQGASHQIFHVLVAFGQLVHLFGLRDVLSRQYR